MDDILIVLTKSGSIYTFNNTQRTWQRQNDRVPEIRFLPGVQSGRLAAPVEPRIGQRLTFFLTGDEWVVTTEVIQIRVQDE